MGAVGNIASQLEEHYGSLPREGGFDSRCHMAIPEDLDGMTVVDIGCRRGKGVFKISDRVGSAGRVIGVDWRPSLVDEALAASGNPAAREHPVYPGSGSVVTASAEPGSVEFLVAYPEQLSGCIAPGSADLVFVNSVLNLTFSPATVLAEACRILRPGGLLVCHTVVADSARDPEVVEEARAVGNPVQSAPGRQEMDTWLADAGFDVSTARLVEEYPIDIDAASKASERARTVAGEPDVHFIETLVHVRKPS